MAAPASSHTEFVTRTEAALRASEALKTAILETALDAIVTIDQGGRILDFNPAAEKMFGHTRDEVLGREMAETIIPSRLRERHRLGLARAVATGEDTIVGRRIEISALRKDGEEFPVELAITRIRVNGAPIFTGHIRDITDRKQAELRRATQLAVTRVLASAPNMAEATPQILRAVCEQLEWDVGTIWRIEGAELRCMDVWHGDKPRYEEFERATRASSFGYGVGLPGRTWATGEPQSIPDVVLDTNFPRAPLAHHVGLHGAFAFPIRLGGQVIGVTEFFSRNIRHPSTEMLEMFSTIGGQIGQFIERQRAENAVRELNADLERRVADATRGLRESQECFSKAFRASPAFVSIARIRDGHFVEVNEAFLQSSGHTREEVIGHTSAELGLWPEARERAHFLEEVQERGFVRHREVTLRSKQGRIDTVLLSAELIEIESQPHILAVGLNITSRKQAEDEMRRALEQEKELSRLKTNFVTLVSHEFRTPLGIIMSAADILKRYFERLTPARREEHLQDIHDASRRMAELMDEVLLLARVEAGRMECRPTPIDLRTFCLRLAEEMQAASSAAGRITVRTARLPAGAAADEALLRHIFHNLLGNALKYSSGPTPVEFGVECDRLDALFTVRDQGIGIPEADLHELFQAFRRGSNVSERPGSGLGLVIVKRCVDLHGGTIRLESKEGAGTTVTVRLPLFRTASGDSTGHPPPPPPATKARAPRQTASARKKPASRPPRRSRSS
jgi:PAS domain S-box-containing protein